MLESVVTGPLRLPTVLPFYRFHRQHNIQYCTGITAMSRLSKDLTILRGRRIGKKNILSNMLSKHQLKCLGCTTHYTKGTISQFLIALTAYMIASSESISLVIDALFTFPSRYSSLSLNIHTQPLRMVPQYSCRLSPTLLN